MKTSFSYNPFDGKITIIIQDLSGASEDYFKIAEMLKTTIEQDIRKYFLTKQVLSDIHRLGKGGEI